MPAHVVKTPTSRPRHCTFEETRIDQPLAPTDAAQWKGIVGEGKEYKALDLHFGLINAIFESELLSRG